MKNKRFLPNKCMVQRVIICENAAFFVFFTMINIFYAVFFGVISNEEETYPF